MFNYPTTPKQTGSSLKNYLALTGVLEGEEEDYLLNNRTVLACVIVYWFIKRRWWVLRYCVISLLREDVRY